MDLVLKLLLIAHAFAIINGYLMKTPNCSNGKSAITTVSGPLAPKGKIQPGQLIFEDNFDKFDLNTWTHSLTLSGKGVSSESCKIYLQNIKIQRLLNSNGTQATDQILLRKMVNFIFVQH